MDETDLKIANCELQIALVYNFQFRKSQGLRRVKPVWAAVAASLELCPEYRSILDIARLAFIAIQIQLNTDQGRIAKELEQIDF